MGTGMVPCITLTPHQVYTRLTCQERLKIHCDSDQDKVLNENKGMSDRMNESSQLDLHILPISDL